MKMNKKSRKDVCSDLDFKYTTFSDWVNGNTYPRLDALENLADYFGVDISEFMIDRQSEMENFDNTAIFSDGLNMRNRSVITNLISSISFYLESRQKDALILSGPLNIYDEYANKVNVDPDIAIICDRDGIVRDGYVGAPEWIVEISTDMNTASQMKDKLLLCEKIGIKEYWMIDPDECRIFTYALKNGQYSDCMIYYFDETVNVSCFEGMKIRISEKDLVHL